MSKRKSRLKIIPDRVFDKLWNDAAKIDQTDQFVKKYTDPDSKSYIDFYRKYDIDPDDAVRALLEIHKKCNTTFKDIIVMAKKRKADISHTFCIPIRTVEEWYSGNNKCAPYIKLMIFRQYHLLNLGKYIVVESDKERKESIPHIYNISNIKKKSRSKTEKANTGNELSKKVNSVPFENTLCDKPNFDKKIYEISKAVKVKEKTGPKKKYDFSNIDLSNMSKLERELYLQTLTDEL